MKWIEKLTPRTHKNWLLLTAGVMWTGVGIFLITLALEWMFAPDVDQPWIYWLPGILLALAIFQFGFSRLSRKNSRRIVNLETEKPCLFAFQEWHSYPLVLFMIALGISLRKFSPIPKPLLGILYTGIGGGLGLASFYYYREIIRSPIWQKQDPEGGN